MDAVTRLLSDLVAIPSVNPMGRAAAGPEFLETAVADYLEGWFRGLGVEWHRVPVAPGRDNLVARYEASGARRTILFDAHQDTVPVEGMTVEPFSPMIANGRLYGRGACDVKGGLSAMLVAFARLVRERPSGSASVIMACTVDEEFTHLGSSRLAESDHRAALAIVAEPTRLNLVDRHKGVTRWKVATHGVACHSSRPELGANAIYRMAAVVSALAEYAERLSTGPGDPVLGPPTLSVGTIDGGQSVNIVPDRCVIEVDRRVIPGETPAEARDRTNEFLTSRLGHPDWLELLPPWVNMPALSPDSLAASGYIEPIVRAVGRAIGRAPEVGGVPYGTDAGPLGATGLPCLVFGPGDIAQAHTKDEWIELDELRTAAEAYFAMACALGR